MNFKKSIVTGLILSTFSFAAHAVNVDVIHAINLYKENPSDAKPLIDSLNTRDRNDFDMWLSQSKPGESKALATVVPNDTNKPVSISTNAHNPEAVSDKQGNNTVHDLQGQNAALETHLARLRFWQNRRQKM